MFLPFCIVLLGSMFIRSDQISRSVVSDSLRPREFQQARPPFPSPTPLKLTSIESVMPSSHLILCRPLLLLPQSLPASESFPMSQPFARGGQSTGVSALSKEIPGLISFRMDWLDLLAVQGTLKRLLQHTVQKHQFFGAQPSSQFNSHIHT